MSVLENLARLGIRLPPLTPPAAAFVPFVRSGPLVFLSGHIARTADGAVLRGQLGDAIALEAGQAAARQVAIDLLGTLQAAAGDLEHVRRVVKLTVFVNSTAAFTGQHLVANAASELLQQVLGEAGAHARSAIGVAQVPFGSCVEIELIAELRGAVDMPVS
jgi:enamine deaminase RidA (YjgF/YER057c/UK114 family)